MNLELAVWASAAVFALIVVLLLVALELRRRVDRRWDEIERKWRDRDG